MRNLNIFLFFLLFLPVACEKEIVQTNITKEVVVESYIQPGDSIGVQLKRILLFYGTDTVVQTIDDCNISVSINGTKNNLIASDSGLYYLKDEKLNIKEYDSISMSFSYADIKIEANTIIPSKPVNFACSATSINVPTFEPGETPSIEQLKLSWDNPDNSYYMVTVQPTAVNPTPINANKIFNNDQHMFRIEPSISSSYSISSMEFRYAGQHYVILYHLNPVYASLYKFSGNTSLNINEPPTNIVNGFGIFTGMNSDTLYLYVKSGK